MSASLSTIRHELGDLVGADIDVVSPALGGNINAPCVVVGHDSPYLTPDTYQAERVGYVVWVVAAPGEASARLDDLDDRVDGVRAALRKRSASGLAFTFESADPPGDVDGLLVCGVHVSHLREC